MNDDISTGNTLPQPARVRRFVPVQVGSATVFIEETGGSTEVEAGDQIRPVAVPSPQEVFENAAQVVRECVRVVGERIEAISAAARPQEISVEFSLSFEAKGKASLIPVFVTGEAGTQTGLKVTAKWTRESGQER
jgi:hypothetical protein